MAFLNSNPILTNMQHLISSVMAVAEESGDWRDYPCLLWDRGLVYGYGQVSSGHKNNRVHRVAWKTAKGDIPKGVLVCHHCDVRNCYRPVHLFLGSQSDNIQDCVRKGRYVSPATSQPSCLPRGEAHALSVLTTEEVLAIRKSYAEGAGQTQIARSLGLRQSYIHKIVHREIWRHV